MCAEGTARIHHLFGGVPFGHAALGFKYDPKNGPLTLCVRDMALGLHRIVCAQTAQCSTIARTDPTQPLPSPRHDGK